MENDGKKEVNLPTEMDVEDFPWVEVIYPKSSSPFCVDGREGKRKKPIGPNESMVEIRAPYPQTLGGSLNSAVVAGILRKDKNGRPVLATQNFINVAKGVFGQLRHLGFGLGLHSGKHAKRGERSDCGFADNLHKIITYLREEHEEEIWNILTEKKLVSEDDRELWDYIIRLLKQVDLDNIPDGDKIIEELKKEEGVAFQILEGDHQEVAATINYVEGTTLDTDLQQTPAFNLDIYRVEEEAKALGIKAKLANILTLGLYVATEIALVEDKGKTRLPILVRK